MSLKSILVNLNDANRAEAMTGLALDLAEKNSAHVIGLYVRPAMQIYPAVGMQVSPEMYEIHDKYFQDASDEAEKLFNAALARSGVSGEWRSVRCANAAIATKIVEHGLQSDLIMMSQVDPDNTGGIEPDCAEQVVMESGRPVLLLPTSGTFKTVGNNILVGWNGTREAARAAFDAVPFMQDAKSVRLVWIDAHQDESYAGNLPGAEMAASLARHDITVSAEALPSGDVSAGDTLLNAASDYGSDLLVMGAYGHSRIREFVFGGVTRNVLKHMTIPVLMSQ